MYNLEFSLLTLYFCHNILSGFNCNFRRSIWLSSLVSLRNLTLFCYLTCDRTISINVLGLATYTEISRELKWKIIRYLMHPPIFLPLACMCSLSLLTPFNCSCNVIPSFISLKHYLKIIKIINNNLYAYLSRHAFQSLVSLGATNKL